MSTTFSGLFQLLRPLNCGIAALSVAVGGITAGALLPSFELVTAALAAASVAAAGNVFNDVCDVEIDRVNRPDRPLPGGKVGPGTALVEAALLAAAGLVAAWWLGPATGLIAMFTLVLLYLYSRYLKRTAVWGNLAVAAAGAAAFPFGAVATGSFGRSWIPAGFALLFHLGREIVKDLEDVTGDGQAGARTLPLRWGAAAAVWSSGLIFLILIALTAIPRILDVYGDAYLALVMTMNLMVAIAVVRLWRSHRDGAISRGRGSQTSMLLKGCMLLGLVAVVAGELL